MRYGDKISLPQFGEDAGIYEGQESPGKPTFRNERTGERVTLDAFPRPDKPLEPEPEPKLEPEEETPAPPDEPEE